MTQYVGIDLGTTNSAICSFDGRNVTIHKSPEQNDVTPSALYVDKRGNRFVGLRAYTNAARSPDNAAVLFKRLIGTSTPIHLSAVNITMTPEECSSEVIQTLFGYLPEAIRNDPDIGTVVTVPAAFNQMQKDATLKAARAAGLGKVALMQEPVAAVMSVMHSRRIDGIFLVYDLGGGTLDIAIAQSSGGRVNLLGQGGIAMCGGRDFDRRIFDSVVYPWLRDTFDLPEDFVVLPEYRSLRRMAELAVEKAKVDLSSREESIVAATEDEVGVRDRAGNEIYFDLPLTRSQVDGLIADKVRESIDATRETIAKAALSANDIERIVFVGGPTQYSPLRDRVAFELGVAASTDVNPMTAVASGAAIFAESIDWSSHSRGRKSARGTVSVGSALQVTVNYVSRTPETKAKVALKLAQPPVDGSAFQVDSLDTGWTSGRGPLKNGTIIEVPLNKDGENRFKIFVFDPSGGPITLAEDRIVIARTAATVDAIPASHSIGIEARDGVGGPLGLVYLVKVGDQLPKKDRITFRAETSLRAGSDESLRFKLWEGDITHPISDNAYIGLFEIKGSDFDEGVILAGSELVLKYEIRDSGVIRIEVDIDGPSLKTSFGSEGRSFYAPNSAKRDFSLEATRVLEDAKAMGLRVSEFGARVTDKNLDKANERIERAAALSPTSADPEAVKQASDDVQEAKRLMAESRQANLQVIRQGELNKAVADFDNFARGLAKPAEIAAFEKLTATAQEQIASPGQHFEARLREMAEKMFAIFARQDFFIVDRFNLYATEWAHGFAEVAPYEKAIEEGRRYIAANDMARLREVVGWLDRSHISITDANEMIKTANIVKT